MSADIAAAAVPTLVDRAHVHEADLDGAALVFAASDDPELDGRVAAAARARGFPINVVDGPSESNFIMPAIVDRDPIVVAIGTEGAAPILAREIKAKIESWLPAQFGRVAQRARAAPPRAGDHRRPGRAPPRVGSVAAGRLAQGRAGRR